MNYYVKNQKGISLVEILAALSIFSIISISIYSVWTFGVQSYNRISLEGQLRDEADMIMTTLMNELYELNPSQASNVPLVNDENHGNTDNQITSLPQELFTENNTTYFTSIDKYTINPNTELVSGSQMRERLFIICKDNNIILYKEKEIADQDNPTLTYFEPTYGVEGKVINSEKLAVLSEINTVDGIRPPILPPKQIGKNDHFLIDIMLKLQPLRKLETSEHIVELQSRFSL